MNITIIGSGNVATMLAIQLHKTEHTIIEIVGRNKKTVTALAKKVKAKPVTNIKLLNAHADIYIIAVNDSAIAEVASNIHLSNKLIIHTSGSTSIKVLQKATKNYGVIWPLQTISATTMPTSIPMVIGANNKKNRLTLIQLAKAMQATEIVLANDEQRKAIHLSAVVANNFINHVFTLLFPFCKKNSIPVSLLLPIINQTVSNFKHQQSATTQTGPAVRGDVITIEAHLLLLQKYPALLAMYKNITTSIQQHTFSNT